MKIFLLAIGIVFVVSVLLTRVLAYQIAREYPPVGVFAEIDGIRLHYVDTGRDTGRLFCRWCSSTGQAAICGICRLRWRTD